MRILLDTHLLLWAMAASRKLPRTVRTQLLDSGNEVYYSAASLWEIAIKGGLRRKDFRIDPSIKPHVFLPIIYCAPWDTGGGPVNIATLYPQHCRTKIPTTPTQPAP